jgi:hypothetical protein
LIAGGQTLLIEGGSVREGRYNRPHRLLQHGRSNQSRFPPVGVMVTVIRAVVHEVCPSGQVALIETLCGTDL